MTLTIECSPDCQRANRIFLARCYRQLCGHLGIDRPPPRSAHLDHDRIERAMAERLGPLAGHMPLSGLIGQMALHPDGRGVVAVYDQTALACRIRGELRRLQRDRHGWAYGAHQFKGSMSGSDPLHLWANGWEDGRYCSWKWPCQDPKDLLTRLANLEAPADDGRLIAAIGDLLGPREKV